MDDILNRAEELIGEDRLEEAISLLRNVDLVEAYILRSEALRRLGKVEEALRELDAGLEKFPFSYVILATKAEVLESMGGWMRLLIPLTKSWLYYHIPLSTGS